MTNLATTNTLLHETTLLLRTHWRRWLIPAALIATATGYYALAVYQPKWEVTQALTVRDEVTSGTAQPGRFDTPESLKNVQETILELVMSPAVVSSALRQIGPSTSAPKAWPSAIDVAKVRADIQIAPPNGAELGATELFFLKVKSVQRERAIKLTKALWTELENRYQQLRNRKTQSVIDELSKAVELAQSKLDEATAKLVTIERQVGPELSELRALSDPNSGPSTLQTTNQQLQQELRLAEDKRATDQHLLELLTAARQDPNHLVATANRLLEALPAIRRLKDGLIDAQLQTSQLIGIMSTEHPRVRAALAAEQEIRDHLHHELDLAVRGLQAELDLSESQIVILTARLQAGTEQLERLVGIRARYATLAAEVQRRTDNLTTAQHDLTAALARRAAAHSTSLISQVGGPETGAYPTGPRRSAILAAGCVGGLLAGFGLVVLTVLPPAPQPTAATGALQDTAPRMIQTTPEVAQSAPVEIPRTASPAPHPTDALRATQDAAPPTFAASLENSQPLGAEPSQPAPTRVPQPRTAVPLMPTIDASGEDLTLTQALARVAQQTPH